jgi:hypothetical protein
MTRKALNMAIFEGTTNAVLWQPRLETWIWHHMERGTLPARYRGMTPLEIYDALRCSVRYGYGHFEGTPIESYNDPDDVVVTEEQQGDHFIITRTTPSGSIRTIYRDVWEEGRLVNRRIEQHPVSTVQDLRVLIDLTEREQFRPNRAGYDSYVNTVGDRAEPTCWLASAGFTDLVKWWCGLAETFYLWADHPDEVEAFLEACLRRDHRQLDAAFQLPFRLFNYGDHATNEFSPPPILERYLLPRWQELNARIHEHNGYVSSHWDGNARTILRYLKETDLDAVEALTPEPMGDITLEEIKAAVGDQLICLDLLPAIMFMENYTTEELLDYTKKVIDMFAPRLILGVSDEISQVGQIEKIEAISELVESRYGTFA